MCMMFVVCTDRIVYELHVTSRIRNTELLVHVFFLNVSKQSAYGKMVRYNVRLCIIITIIYMIKLFIALNMQLIMKQVAAVSY